MNTTPRHTAKSAAETLRVSVSTVYRWLKNGEIEKHGYTGQKIKGRWVITTLTAIPVSAATVEDAIISACKALAREPGAWIRLAALRRHLTTWTRSEVDEALSRMWTNAQINLADEPNRHRLTAEDRAAALRDGGEDNHLMRLS